MTVPMRGPRPGLESQRRVDGRQLWAGGVATAIVAALIALVGILISRWLANIPILSPQKEGAWGNASTVGYTLAAAACALVATALMHLLLLSTPRPRVFFGWIVGLATLVAVVYPFSTTAPLSQKLATGFVNLILGVAIGTLIYGVSLRATRRYLVRRDYDTTSYPPSRAPGEGGYR